MSRKNVAQTFVRILGAVKRGSDDRRTSTLDGIGAVLTLGVILVGAALLAIPRVAEPRLLPLPQPDRQALARAWRTEAELAERARRAQLPFAVRAVGETFRRIGIATVEERGVPERLLEDLDTQAATAHAKAGGPALLSLRAVQTALFVRAARDFEASGRASRELRELGGDFVEVATARGWLKGGRFRLDDEELAILFRMRWTELTKTGDKPPLSPSLDEYRAFYALLLGRALAGKSSDFDRTALHAIARLERLDPSYPAGLARGVLLYRRQAYAAAAEAFRDELGKKGDGPWRLRTRNHLLAALAKLPEEE